MTPLAGELVGYLSMFLQLGILVLLTGLAMLVRVSLGRRAVDGWTLGLAAYAAALGVLSAFSLGHVAGVFRGAGSVAVGYAVLEDVAALAFAATIRRERGLRPLPRWLWAVFVVAVAATAIAAGQGWAFFGIYRVHVAGFALLLGIGAFASVRAHGTGIGSRLVTVALAALALDYLHVPLLTLLGVKFNAYYPALESYVTMVLDIALGVAIVVHATDGVRDELAARNIALAEAQRALRDAAYLDALCRIPNRAAFLERIAAPPAAGTVAMIDVDGLKTINDSFGHAAGDAVLRAAARCLRERCGENGTVYRIGGDEFACIWETSTADDVRALLTAIDGDLAILAGDAAAPARISWGVATFGAQAPFDAALIAADGELYDSRSIRRA
ncbi:MAG: diguanylate cyclase protein [Candidatus Eremiobacteraeota bacterium]|nr:diguanylate cyclase protein [Candidatus Eremiobacteraeota bacterium]